MTENIGRAMLLMCTVLINDYYNILTKSFCFLISLIIDIV